MYETLIAHDQIRWPACQCRLFSADLIRNSRDRELSATFGVTYARLLGIDSKHRLNPCQPFDCSTFKFWGAFICADDCLSITDLHGIVCAHWQCH